MEWIDCFNYSKNHQKSSQHNLNKLHSMPTTDPILIRFKLAQEQDREAIEMGSKGEG
jgi:hypothetical protein